MNTYETIMTAIAIFVFEERRWKTIIARAITGTIMVVGISIAVHHVVSVYGALNIASILTIILVVIWSLINSVHIGPGTSRNQ